MNEVVDLMEALKASVDRARSEGNAKKKPSKTTSARRKATKRSAA